MIEVQFNGFVKDQNSRDEIDSGSGWAEWRVLDLVDEKGFNPEWFFVAACNQYYFDKKIASSALKTAGYVIQDVFNEGDLRNSVSNIFNDLSFEDWDDFYTKMNAHFIPHDD